MSVATERPAALRLRVRTPRLLLRPWRPGDGRAAKEAIDASLEHLRPWMPWARGEPSPVEAVEARLAAFRQSFMNGLDWVYAIFPHDQHRVMGGAGLHTRQGPGILEIGYWVRADAVRQGVATEAAAALARCAVERHRIAKVEIRCEPGNTTSARIPVRLGFRFRERVVAPDPAEQGAIRELDVFEIEAREITSKWLAAHPVTYEQEED
jgi:RimJ/RimL family protein N-acetyltransferase